MSGDVSAWEDDCGDVNAQDDDDAESGDVSAWDDADTDAESGDVSVGGDETPATDAKDDSAVCRNSDLDCCCCCCRCCSWCSWEGVGLRGRARWGAGRGARAGRTARQLVVSGRPDGRRLQAGRGGRGEGGAVGAVEGGAVGTVGGGAVCAVEVLHVPQAAVGAAWPGQGPGARGQNRILISLTLTL